MKILNFSALILFLLVVACGDGDFINSESGVNPNINAAPMLEGTWEAQSFSAMVETEVEAGEETIISTFDIEGQDLDYVLTFTESAYTTAGSYGFGGEAKAGETTIPIEQSYSDVKGEGTYSVSDNEITSNGAFFELTVDGMDLSALQEEVTATIEKLTDSELIFVQDTEQTVTQEEGGVSFMSTSKMKSRSVWKRR